MSVELYLARRYLKDHRHGAWGGVISWLATISVAIGVAALIVTLAVMNGFRSDIRSKILGVQPHLTITSNMGVLNPSDSKIPAVLSKEKDVVAWAPYVTGQGLIGRGGTNTGVLIKGIDPESEVRVSNIGKALEQGTWDDLHPASKGEKPAIFLGIELARNLGVRKGDSLWIVAPEAMNVPMLGMPKAHFFVVKGFVRTGLYDYDSSFAYVHLKDAQTLFDLGTNVTGIGVRVKNPDASIDIAPKLQAAFLGLYWVRSWLALNHNLFSALKLEKVVMFIVVTLVTVVASVMIVSNLLLVISQKVREIGILRAMGATAGTIRRVFLFQGVLMGVIGNGIGVILGLLISGIVAKTSFIKLPPDVYYIDKVPIAISPWDVLSVVGVSCFIIFLASILPAQRAAKLDPLEAIRYG